MSIEQVTKQYRTKTPQSARLFEKAKTLLPGAVGGSAPTIDPYPMFFHKGKGSTVYDVDGNEYLDFNLCWGVLIVGHRHPLILEGLRDQLEYGTIFGFPHEESWEVANALANRFSIEKVRFVNSGSEATLYAVRLARRFTGKNKIIKTEGAYHGVSDSLHISKKPSLEKAGPAHHPKAVPHGEGITETTIKDTLIVPFNNSDAITALLDEHHNNIGAIIVEPAMMNAGVISPVTEYLKTLRELADKHDVVLIFDEVKTGVKLAAGGATEYFGVRPDLVCLAKAMGGGLPIGACGGKAAIMDGIDAEGLFGTYSANPLSIRAAKITLTEILTKQAYTKLETLGNNLLAGYQDIITDHKLKAIVQGINANGGILFTEEPVRDYRTWTKVDKATTHHYWLSMANEGIIPMAYGADEEWLISVQHTAQDTQRHVDVFNKIATNL
jgi:glutamate-1-semialdehyde 2,1-aminomutase